MLEGDSNVHEENRWFQISREELLAIFRCLYPAGVLRAGHLHIPDLWSDIVGPAPFKAMVSRERFEHILKFLRFDLKVDRQERQAVDKLAPIRLLWEAFLERCRNNYIPSWCVTIDEHLQYLHFEGELPFEYTCHSSPQSEFIAY